MDPFLPVRGIAQTLLYEGYALFPYGAVSLKNRRRISFGELAPGARLASAVPFEMTNKAVFEAQIGFLQPIRRTVRDSFGREVSDLTIADRDYVSFTEARERKLSVGPLDAAALARAPFCFRFTVDAFDSTETIQTDNGEIAASIIRTGHSMMGELRLAVRDIVAHVDEPRHAILEVELSLVEASNEADSELSAIHSPHLGITVTGSEFISTTDPPESLRAIVDVCEFEGWWPILVGDKRSRNLVLMSPIILYDYPELAPESPGDLFDATENDELLTLSILALTDAERRAMKAMDPRGAEILARCDALGERLGALHGATRSFERGIAIGDSVRCKTRGRDSFDTSLDGQLGRVVAIEVEVTGREHLVVVLDDDPGRELGLDEAGVGHRFFLARSEVERVKERGGGP